MKNNEISKDQSEWVKPVLFSLCEEDSEGKMHVDVEKGNNGVGRGPS